MTNEVGLPVQRRTLGEQIADRIRREVLYGALTCRQSLTQEALSARYGVSRIPVRDAIRQLVYEGVLVVDSAGTHPAELTEADVGDMFRIEASLHSLAASLMIERASKSEVGGLVVINERMRAALAASDFAAVTDANVTFHRQINVLAKSNQLIRALRSCSVRIHADFLLHFPEEAAAAIHDHDSFLDAVRVRDKHRASSLIEQHVLKTALLLLRNKDQKMLLALKGTKRVSEQESPAVPPLY